jgi:hypothetical protein
MEHSRLTVLKRQTETTSEECGFSWENRIDLVLEMARETQFETLNFDTPSEINGKTPVCSWHALCA